MLLLQNNGRTALHSACRSGHVEVVEFLIIKNADISAIDKVSDHAVSLIFMGFKFTGVNNYIN